MDVKLIARVTFDAATLVQDHPPQWHHPHKTLVYAIACASSAPVAGEVVYARWAEQAPAATLSAQPPFSIRAGVFAYGVAAGSRTVDWHMNFADPRLFVAYGSALMAQDELQVAEHPILGSVYEALVASGMSLGTVDERGRPTPVTITGVQRRCAIDTGATPERPAGLYGNAFAQASEAEVQAATRVLSPPTVSNILAIAAPYSAQGRYTREQMRYILHAAYTGFAAASRESARMVPTAAHPVVHTGFWGCGAFGGNRTLMTVLQSLAADLAGVALVFWVIAAADLGVAEDARAYYEELRRATASVPGILDALVEAGFEWGISDGN